MIIEGVFLRFSVLSFYSFLLESTVHVKLSLSYINALRRPKDMSLTMQELPKNASANAHSKSKHREWMTIRPVRNRQYLELYQKRTVFIRILLKTENLFGFAHDQRFKSAS